MSAMSKLGLDKIIVRRLVPEDRPLLRLWLNDPAVRQALEDETLDFSKIPETMALFESSDPFCDGALGLIVEVMGRPIGRPITSTINPKAPSQKGSLDSNKAMVSGILEKSRVSSSRAWRTAGSFNHRRRRGRSSGTRRRTIILSKPSLDMALIRHPGVHHDVVQLAIMEIVFAQHPFFTKAE